MTKTQTCPRRMQEWGPWEKVENLDSWRRDDTCSFCGSYNPDLLLGKLRTGELKLSPTDKNYKVYLYVDNKHFHKFYFQHFSLPQRTEFIELYNEKGTELFVGTEYEWDFYVLPFFMVYVD